MSTPIKMYRGDTQPLAFVAYLDGVVRDITGLTFALTVSSVENPVAESPVLELSGTITDAEAGEIEFPFADEAEADITPGIYWYDIEARGSTVETVSKGRFVVVQDISK